MNKSIVKYITLFSSIIALILGIIIMTNVAGSTILVNYLLVIALGVIGLSRLCVFASAKDRSGWDLVAGILFLIACVFLLSKDALTIGVVMGIVLGVVTLIDGIGRFMIAAEARKISKKAPIGGLVASGILAVLVGIALFFLPVFGEALYIMILGIFLVVLGIYGFIYGLCINVGRKK